MNTLVVHPGFSTAAQTLAFFAAHGIKGQPLGTRRGRLLVQYTCLTKFLDGSVAPFDHRILALPEHHNL